MCLKHAMQTQRRRSLHIGKTHDQHLEACCRGISSCWAGDNAQLPSSHLHCYQYLNGAKLRLSDLHNDDSRCRTTGCRDYRSQFNVIPRTGHNLTSYPRNIFPPEVLMVRCDLKPGIPTHILHEIQTAPYADSTLRNLPTAPGWVMMEQ